MREPDNPPPMLPSIESRMRTIERIVQRLDGVSNAAELGAALIEIGRPIGGEAALIGFLPQILLTQPLKSDITPDEWELLSSHASIIREKPTIQLIDMDRRLTHFFFRDPRNQSIQYSRYEDDDAAAAASLWTHFDGLAVPILSVAQFHYGIAFLGRKVSHETAATELLSFVANYAFARTLKIDRLAEFLTKLTERQLEVLNWAAKGKTDQEISEILNLSVHTVDKYMRQCREALNAVNRAALIMLAMRYGLIT